MNTSTHHQQDIGQTVASRVALFNNHCIDTDELGSLAILLKGCNMYLNEEPRRGRLPVVAELAEGGRRTQEEAERQMRAPHRDSRR